MYNFAISQDVMLIVLKVLICLFGSPLAVIAVATAPPGVHMVGLMSAKSGEGWFDHRCQQTVPTEALGNHSVSWKRSTTGPIHFNILSIIFSQELAELTWDYWDRWMPSWLISEGKLVNLNVVKGNSSIIQPVEIDSEFNSITSPSFVVLCWSWLGWFFF